MRSRWLLIGVVVASPALAAEQFDLVCRGQVRWAPAGKLQPVERRYRVDLTAGTWCLDACTATEQLASVGQAEIVFKQADRTLPPGAYFEHTVNRTTGAWKNTYIQRGAFSTYWDYSGTCEPAPFSGMPATKF